MSSHFRSSRHTVHRGGEAANQRRHAFRPLRLAILVSCLSIAGLLAAVVLPSSEAAAAPSLWSITSSPDQGTSSNYLYGVSCTGPMFCVAVGFYSDAGVAQTLIESWNGSTWSITSSPNQNANANYLSGVSCTSATNCVAVGDYYDNSGVLQTLTEAWNGSAWSITSSPNQGGGDNHLDAVSCTSPPTNCVAVGFFIGASGDQTLVESGNGTAWSITSSPSPGDENYLYGVSCTSSSNCVAVGGDESGSVIQTLIESWNGTAWSVPSSPSPGSNDNDLNAVSCTDAKDCVAVGQFSNGSSASQTLIESWDGTAWSVTSSPNHGKHGNDLIGTSCTSATSCVAAGVYATASGVTQPLIQSWDGTAWSITHSPHPSSGENSLQGVSCTSSSSCEAAGWSTNGSSVVQSLIETGTVPPTITKFTPLSGAVGKKVTISGTNLSGATAVTFNGTAAQITKDTATKIKTTVPTGATTGRIQVTTPGGTATSAASFTVT
jgi:hypothetical protein